MQKMISVAIVVAFCVALLVGFVVSGSSDSAVHSVSASRQMNSDEIDAIYDDPSPSIQSMPRVPQAPGDFSSLSERTERLNSRAVTLQQQQADILRRLKLLERR